MSRLRLEWPAGLFFAGGVVLLGAAGDGVQVVLVLPGSELADGQQRCHRPFDTLTPPGGTSGASASAFQAVSFRYFVLRLTISSRTASEAAHWHEGCGAGRHVRQARGLVLRVAR